MKTKIVCLAIGLVLAAIAVFGADANDRFKGGWYDGWAQQDSDAYTSLMPPPAGTLLMFR